MLCSAAGVCENGMIVWTARVYSAVLAVGMDVARCIEKSRCEKEGSGVVKRGTSLSVVQARD